MAANNLLIILLLLLKKLVQKYLRISNKYFEVLTCRPNYPMELNNYIITYVRYEKEVT